MQLRCEGFCNSAIIQNSSYVHQILSDWREIIHSQKITQNLFFSNLEEHGSPPLKPVVKQFSERVRDALQLTITVDEVNLILEGMMNSSHSVQRAVLHQQLVARATCVVMVGGGAFQMQTLNQYAHQHRGHECYVFRNGNCQKKYIAQVYV